MSLDTPVCMRSFDFSVSFAPFACCRPHSQLLPRCFSTCRQGYLRKHLSDFSDQAHLAAPEEVSLAEEVPPPRYRAPPSHKF